MIVLLYAGFWAFFERESFDWHAVATLATWSMTLFIQRSEHRDTQAIHAKLDELLHAQGDAQNSLTHLDEREPEEIEQYREEARKNDENEISPAGRTPAAPRKTNDLSSPPVRR